MEPIEEERSELAMDIAAAVVGKLDIDRKLDERMGELMLRGDKIFRDIQVRQEQSTDALCRAVAMCLESQRTFHEEHQRLLNAVKELATMVMPYTSLSSQALEAQARASAIVEETEVLKKQLEENRVASACAMAAAIGPVAGNMPAALLPAALVQPGANTTFSITLRKADDVSLGLSVNAEEQEDPKALMVKAVLPGGAVDSWNRQCFGDGSGERVVVAGDRIVRVNGIEQDVNKMLEECTNQRLVKLVIARGPPARPSAPLALTPEKLQAPVARHTCEAVDPSIGASTLRKKAPEFVPSGVDAQPLQPTQILAAPPGLFFPRPEDCSINTKFAGGNLEGGNFPRMQEVGDGDDSDKEN